MRFTASGSILASWGVTISFLLVDYTKTVGATISDKEGKLIQLFRRRVCARGGDAMNRTQHLSSVRPNTIGRHIRLLESALKGVTVSTGGRKFMHVSTAVFGVKQFARVIRAERATRGLRRNRCFPSDTFLRYTALDLSLFIV